MYEYTIEITFKWSTVHVVACWYLPFFWKLVMILQQLMINTCWMYLTYVATTFIIHAFTFLSLLNYDLYIYIFMLLVCYVV